MLKFIATVAAGGLLIAGTAASTHPEASSRGVSYVTDFFDTLTKPDCDRQPRKCLLQKQKDLETLNRRIKRTTVSLESEFDRVKVVLRTNKALLGENQLFTSQIRRLLRSATTEGPISFAGVTYPDRAHLRDQAKLLLAEEMRLKMVVADAQSLHDNLQSARRNLSARRSEIEATQAILPAKIALFDVRQSVAELEADQMRIDAVLNAGTLGYREIDSLLRNTRELIDSEVRKPVDEVDFEAWLRQGGSLTD